MTEIRNYKYNFIDAPAKAEGEMIKANDYNFIPEEKSTMNAYHDLMNELEEGEIVEGLVFGDYGWSDFGEEDCDNPIPQNKRGVLLTLEEAKPLMDGWTYHGGFGSPDCYATYVWTNKRIIWVTQYDGSTCLDSTPRHPISCKPNMPGG
jgi:hypothetical protein